MEIATSTTCLRYSFALATSMHSTKRVRSSYTLLGSHNCARVTHFTSAFHCYIVGNIHIAIALSYSNNKDTHEATITLLPSTMHPQSWAEPHIHVHTGKSLPPVPPSPEEHNLPSLYPASTPASCRSSFFV